MEREQIEQYVDKLYEVSDLEVIRILSQYLTLVREEELNGN